MGEKRGEGKGGGGANAPFLNIPREVGNQGPTIKGMTPAE